MPDAARRRKNKQEENSLHVEFGAVEYDQYNTTTDGIVVAIDEKSEKKKKRRRRRKRIKDDDDYNNNDEPHFGLIVLQVGTVLFIICCVVYAIYCFAIKDYIAANYSTDTDETDDWVSNQMEQQEMNNNVEGNGSDNNDNNALQEGLDETMEYSKEKQNLILAEKITPKPTLPKNESIKIPVFDYKYPYLTKFDAYGIHEIIHNSKDNDSKSKNSRFWIIAQNLRQEFITLYGSENSVRAMLQRGLTTFGGNVFDKNNSASKVSDDPLLPKDLIDTSCRILDRSTNKDIYGNNQKFTMNFGGYSVTAGHGNRYNQSYPFVIERLLHDAFDSINVDLVVRNSAIGGSPAFPYGWCLPNFIFDGTDEDVNADLVSWDYSMNEAGGIPEGIEAYIRHVARLNLHSSNNNNRNIIPPKFLIKDTHMAQQRHDLLHMYYNDTVVNGDEDNANAKTDSTSNSNYMLLSDPLIIHTDPAIEPFLSSANFKKEYYRPIGFQEWKKWGSPNGSPGQVRHHPTKKEHELIGWVIAMNLLASIELVAAYIDGGLDTLLTKSFEKECQNMEERARSSINRNNDNMLLPPPLAKEQLDHPWSSLLYGIPSNSKQQKQTSSPPEWMLRPIHCRTSFEPIRHGDLSSIVISGSIGEDVDVLLPKGTMFYDKGWVLDLSPKEKIAKKQVKRYNLGFVDAKKAYYGTYPSGQLRMFLPYETKSTSSSDNDKDKILPRVGDDARKWYHSIVMCEVNEYRDRGGACNTETDLDFVVGGALVSNNNNKTDVTFQMISSPGTLYLGKRICAYIRVPKDAKITSRQIMIDSTNIKKTILKDNHMIQHHDVERREEENTKIALSTGLSFEVSVKNKHIYDKYDACSISHVIWEQEII